MSWTCITLGEFLTLKRGYDLPDAMRQDGAVPIVTSSGITGYHSVAKVEGPGVVTGRYGTLGEVFYVPEDFWPHNTALYVQDFKGNDPRFVAYFLRNMLRGVSSDKAAVPGVNRNDLHARTVTAPRDLDQQHRIAAILSAYDDLIETNRRRMALLEQAARLLYREWFVQLRFPGHESVRVVDGMPEGWERKRLGEVAPLKYGKALKEDYRIAGTVPVFGSSGIIGTHDKALVQGPGIVVGRKGNAGSVFWSATDFFPIDTVFYIDSDQASLYLYYALLHTTFVSTDVAVPGLNRDYAHSHLILIPAHPIFQSFEDVAAPLHAQVTKLQRYKDQLASARDLLLPRLMSGEIAV
jgi:type I restriction enzyme S subunit